MKLLIIVIAILSIGKSANAETNWNELQEVAKNPKYVHAVNVKDRSELRLVEIGRERYRLDGFKVIPLSQITLLYEGKKELRDLCRGYFENRNRNFKAKLSFPKNNELDLTFFVLEDGNKLRPDMIENPVISAELKVRDLSGNDKTLWIDKTLDSIKMGGDVNQYYVNLFKTHIQNAPTNEVEIDLTELNGLACDIGLGNIKPEIAMNFTLEKSLPSVSFWLKRELFTEIAGQYVQISKNNQLKNQDNKLMEKKQLLLGWAMAMAEISLGVSDDSLLPKVLISENRRMDLIEALEKNREGESLDKAWRRTFEIEIPKIKFVTRVLPHISGDVEVRSID